MIQDMRPNALIPFIYLAFTRFGNRPVTTTKAFRKIPHFIDCDSPFDCSGGRTFSIET